ncbi:hybrid sensor histidine kinase/response regulator [Desulfobulbus alkaliphilus]|uniref:hybrid sensor histidine kinase/response regulator n=1 Tax=Desulfobulbus alkaliphilus TaxID=869814 RepID=UPI0019628C6A|nr:ATP-binding protein [Desulfobulbus alkaliphilus]MBM9536485.1 response regulator [Desulfobulbus alkaliphilus]
MVIGTGWHTNTTLRSVEKNLPFLVLNELHDLTLIFEELSEATFAAELTRSMPSNLNLERLRRKVDTVHDSLIELRQSYVFDNMVQASAFHNLVAPALIDARIWLSEGISGYGPDSETTLAIVQSRLANVFAQSKSLNRVSRESALSILDAQRTRLDRFLLSINVLFAATLFITATLIALLIRQQHFRRREMEHVTALTRTRRSLQQSEELHSKLLATLPDIVLRTDLAGTILFVNEQALDISGYRAVDVIDRNMFDFIAPEDRQRAVKNTRDMMNQPLGPREYQLIMKNGDLKNFEVNGSVLRDTENNPYGIVLVCRDSSERLHLIAERRQLEERLHRVEKMEALGTLAGGVAHDLNNVLGGLVGYSELLLMKIPPDNPLHRYVSNIFESGQRGAAIIQDLLTLARRGVSVNQVVNLNTLIQEALNTLEFQQLKTSAPGILFTTDLDNTLLDIKGSSVHLGKTILNLIFNAVEAMEGSGQVTIRTENRHLDAPISGYDTITAGDYVLLSVEDTGHGIAESDLKKIFEPFYTKKVMGRSGTGLGLAVVWGTVKDHQGYVDVHSEEGKGSRFMLYFPATSEHRAEALPFPPSQQYKGHGETILVVDDVETQRELARNMLSSIGYEVIVAPSGEAALAYLQTGNQVDLVMLDMIMDPGIDGLETYHRILKIRPGQKAILVSGFSETENVRRALQLGAGSYVRKPYLMETLAMAVRNELEK